MGYFPAVKSILRENPGLTARELAASTNPNGKEATALRHVRRALSVLADQGKVVKVDRRYYMPRYHDVPDRQLCLEQFTAYGGNFTCCLWCDHIGEHQASEAQIEGWRAHLGATYRDG